MSEDLPKFLDALTDALDLDAASIPMTHKELACLIRAIRRALATQPDADPVPELPEFVTQECDGHWTVHLKDGRRERIYGRSTPDDLDRIAEAARILAARERARRAP